MNQSRHTLFRSFLLGCSVNALFVCVAAAEPVGNTPVVIPPGVIKIIPPGAYGGLLPAGANRPLTAGIAPGPGVPMVPSSQLRSLAPTPLPSGAVREINTSTNLPGIPLIPSGVIQILRPPGG